MRFFSFKCKPINDIQSQNNEYKYYYFSCHDFFFVKVKIPGFTIGLGETKSLLYFKILRDAALNSKDSEGNYFVVKFKETIENLYTRTSCERKLNNIGQDKASAYLKSCHEIAFSFS